MSYDSLHAEYLELEGQLRGISPKLDLYKRIEARMQEIKQQIGGVALEKQKGVKTINSASGIRIRVYEGSVRQQMTATDKCTHKKPEGCRIEGCTNTPRGTGRCGSCGRTRYKNYCKAHRTTESKKALQTV